ncbi:transcriptional regulator [Asaia siamensis NRIC 0323]|nr:transcriptional regulator [Asaia siamensis NRIC 0323]
MQKYERGANKVGASRLYEMSRVLNVPIGFFFDDLAGVRPSNPGFSPQGAGFSEVPPGFNGKGSEMGRDASRFAAKGSDLDESSLELLRAFQRISDERVRRQLVNLVKSMASPE